VATYTDHPPVGGMVTYTATYAGNTDHAPATKSTRLTVTRASAALSISLKYKAIYYDNDAIVHIHLGHFYNGRSVTLFERPAGRAEHRLITAQVNRFGNLTARVHVMRNTTFTAVYAGDYRYAPARKSVIELAATTVHLQLKGFYATSGKYVLYHLGDYIRLVGSVRPAKVGSCVYFDDEVLTKGKFTLDGASPCAAMNAHRIGVMYYNTAKVRVGVPYRFQAYYKGDPVNAGAATGWVYVRVTK
jgi:hypothetical protein